ncbi:MAG: hypothetical protein JAY72_20545 [Candidatus Thiodiazotropha endolucinida]|nr:hypothetical protein [Candidatus Thiodiazotropha taylori]MCW4324072.1 hypothetical protein [Candidatus Thiodiazotropha taylori]
MSKTLVGLRTSMRLFGLGMPSCEFPAIATRTVQKNIHTFNVSVYPCALFCFDCLQQVDPRYAPVYKEVLQIDQSITGRLSPKARARIFSYIKVTYNFMETEVPEDFGLVIFPAHPFGDLHIAIAHKNYLYSLKISSQKGYFLKKIPLMTDPLKKLGCTFYDLRG